MKPLNKKTRSSALLRIAGLFVLSLAISLILGFSLMDFNNISENSSSRELKKINEEVEFQEETFEPAIEELNIKLKDIINKKNSNENIDQDLADLPASITEIKTSIPPEHSWKSLYFEILQTYTDLQTSLKEEVGMMADLERSSGAGEDLARLRQENNDLRGQVKRLESEAASGDPEAEKMLSDAQEQIKKLQEDLDQEKFLSEACNITLKKYKDKYGEL